MTTEKYIGKRPVSERTAKFEEGLFTPKMYLKYLICDLSAIVFLYISSNKNALFFLHAALLVLNIPQISELHNTITFVICKLVYLFIVFGEHGRYIGNINHLW